MPPRARALAWMLCLEGAGCLVWGTWLVITGLSPRAPIGRTGDVVGPPEEWVQGAISGAILVFAAAVLALAALNLAAGVLALRGGLRPWMAAACALDAVALAIAAFGAGLASLGRDAEPRAAWVLLVIYAAWAGVHLLALCDTLRGSAGPDPHTTDDAARLGAG